MPRGLTTYWPTAVATAVLAAAACDGEPFAPDQASLTTTSSTYQLTDYPDRVGVSIPYRFVNATGRALYNTPCALDVGPGLEVLQQGEWVSGIEQLFPCAQEAALPIRDGDVIENVQRFEGGKPGSNFSPEFSVPEGGATYRLVWTFYTQGFRDETPPAETRVLVTSAPFTILPADAPVLHAVQVIGHVTDPAGLPVPGAHLSVASGPFTASPEVEVDGHADEDGRYSFALGETGSLELDSVLVTAFKDACSGLAQTVVVRRGVPRSSSGSTSSTTSGSRAGGGSPTPRPGAMTWGTSGGELGPASYEGSASGCEAYPAPLRFSAIEDLSPVEGIVEPAM